MHTHFERPHNSRSHAFSHARDTFSRDHVDSLTLFQKEDKNLILTGIEIKEADFRIEPMYICSEAF